jgi:hypothetical protein
MTQCFRMRLPNCSTLVMYHLYHVTCSLFFLLPMLYCILLNTNVRGFFYESYQS